MPERPLPWRVSAQNHGKTPLKQASSTHLPQLEGEAAYSERLEQTEMNFQIAPFFSQAPSYRFLGGGAGGMVLGIWKLICTPSTRPAGSRRWRDCSAASTKDGHRWCRPLPTDAPPSPRSSWGPPRRAGAFLQCHGPPPCLVKDSPHLPITGGGVFHKGNERKLVASRGLAAKSLGHGEQMGRVYKPVTT